MKNAVQQEQRKTKVVVKEMYLQMILDEALYNRKKSQLVQAINAALDRRDQEEFLQLSEEYNKLLGSK
jgi:uncharacterized protein YpiB (UPF0302 family)